MVGWKLAFLSPLDKGWIRHMSAGTTKMKKKKKKQTRGWVVHDLDDVQKRITCLLLFLNEDWNQAGFCFSSNVSDEIKTEGVWKCGWWSHGRACRSGVLVAVAFTVRRWRWHFNLGSSCIVVVAAVQWHNQFRVNSFSGIIQFWVTRDSCHVDTGRNFRDVVSVCGVIDWSTGEQTRVQVLLGRLFNRKQLLWVPA